jgi:hypothetical protein
MFLSYRIGLIGGGGATCFISHETGLSFCCPKTTRHLPPDTITSKSRRTLGWTMRGKLVRVSRPAPIQRNRRADVCLVENLELTSSSTDLIKT